MPVVAAGRSRRRAAAALAAAVAAGACRSHDPPKQPPDLPVAGGGPPGIPVIAPGPPPLHATFLAHPLDDAHGLVVDDTYVYYSAFGEHMRVPRTGGPVELAPHWPVDQRHAHDEGDLAYDAGVFFRIQPDGIFRQVETKKRGATWTRIARSFPSNYHKAMVLDGDRLYWIEPAAAAVLSVPTTGGPVSFVCQASIPVDDDLAIHGDTLYLLDIHGQLDAVDKHGGPLRDVGFLGKYLGSNHNGVWMTADDDAIYVVSNAIRTLDMSGQGAVVRVDYPGAGLPLDDEDGGLLFPASPADRQEPGRHPFAGIEDDLKAGRVVVTVSVTTDAANADRGRFEAADAERWLRGELGPGVRTEVVVVAPPPDADPNRRWPWIDVGISRTQVPALFAPSP